MAESSLPPHPSPLLLRIVGTHSVGDGDGDNSYTVYEISVEKGIEQHSCIVYRRYRLFRSFWEAAASALPFPSKRVVGNMDAAFIRQRTRELQAFLSSVSIDAALRRSSLLASFLDPTNSPALLTISGNNIPEPPIKEGVLLTQKTVPVLSGISGAASSISGSLGNLLLPAASRAWKRRWCVLSSQTLCLYVFSSKDPYALPKYSIDLARCSIDICAGCFGDNLHCFVIEKLFDNQTNGRRRQPTFRAETNSDLNNWIDSLRSAASLRSKRILASSISDSTQTDFSSFLIPPPPSTSTTPTVSTTTNLNADFPLKPHRPAPNAPINNETEETQAESQSPSLSPSPPPPIPSRKGRIASTGIQSENNSNPNPNSTTMQQETTIAPSRQQRIRSFDDGCIQQQIDSKEIIPSNINLPCRVPSPILNETSEMTTTTTLPTSNSPTTDSPNNTRNVANRVSRALPIPPNSKTSNTNSNSNSEQVEFTVGSVCTVTFSISPSSPTNQNPNQSQSPQKRQQMKTSAHLIQDRPLSVAISEMSNKLIAQQQSDERIGVFINGQWVEEGTNQNIVDSIPVKADDKVAIRRIDRELSQAMISSSQSLVQLATAVKSREKEEDQSSNNNKPKNLLPGEEILSVIPNIVHVHIIHTTSGNDQSSMIPAATSVVGTMFITNFRLSFIPQQQNNNSTTTTTTTTNNNTTKTSLCLNSGFHMPLAAVQQIDKCYGISVVYGKFVCIVIKSKNFHDMRFSYLINEQEIQRGISPPDVVIESAVFHKTIGNLFAFNPVWIASFEQQQLETSWKIFIPKNEYGRFGVPSSNWRISNVNKDYVYCSSYPESICVPTAFTDRELLSVFAFRSRGRIPALIWLHPENGSALLRCGQPQVGIKGQRCPEDEHLMDLIGAANSNCSTVFIVDARPKIAAKANQLLRGRGFEFGKYYVNTSISFLGIENIHTMSESEAKLRKVVLNEPRSLISSKIPSTKWLQHLRLLISSALDIANRICKGRSVIVHCSDGWDRTPQLTGLSLLILDPYYRTFEGFMVLIEKEWLAFGHMFEKRCRQTPTNEPSAEQSPIFEQFIDCVWQLVSFAKNEFEFNENFLIDILDELYACRFGTFLFNSEMERGVYAAHKNTIPFWLHARLHKDRFINRDFNKNLTAANSQISSLLNQPPIGNGGVPITLKLWESYYLRWRRIHETEIGNTKHGSWRENQTWFFD